MQMLRLPQVMVELGEGRSSVYSSIQRGLLPPMVKIGARAAALPSHEVQAINRARLAGLNEEQIRALVRRMVEERQVGVPQ